MCELHRIPTPERREQLEMLKRELNYAVWAADRCLHGRTEKLRFLGEGNLQQALGILTRVIDEVRQS